jgi:hypothetical protein
VAKLLDVDGDLATTDDQFVGSGWTFDVAVTNGSPASAQAVTDTAGFAEFPIVPGANGALVDVSEVLQVDFVFVDAACAPVEVQAESLPTGFRAQALADDIVGARGTVGDGRVDGVGIADGETVFCLFVNAGGEVAGETGTPRVTPPPTDTLPLTGTPGGDSWRIALLAIASLLATILLLTPATPVKVRRRR